MSFQVSDIKSVAIVSSYNRSVLLRQCLESLVLSIRSSIIGNAAIVVYDNGSADGSKELIEEVIQKNTDIPIRLLMDGLDRSFSEGCNYAVAQSTNEFSSCQTILLFETDNYFQNTSYWYLAHQLLLQREELGAVGFTVQNYRGDFLIFGSKIPLPSAFVIGQKLTHILGIERKGISAWENDFGIEWHPYDVLYTSPCLIKLQAWDAINGFDAELFPFSECDSDLFWRLKKAGYTSAVIKSKGVIHDNKGNASAWSDRRVLDAHRSRFRLFKKHVPSHVIFLKAGLYVRHTLEVIFLIAGILSKNAKQKIKTRFTLLSKLRNGYE